MNTEKGTFIVIDGPDGAGKTKALDALEARFGNRMVRTREPGGTPYAEEIREIILNSEHAGQADGKTLSLLFWASRRDHVQRLISPALCEGKLVVSDRFDSSTYAYQIHAQQKTDLKESFFEMRRQILEGLCPDLYIFLDVEVEEGLRRKTNGDVEVNHLDQRARDFYVRMKEGFDEFFDTEKAKVRSVTIDANQPMESVHAELIKVVEAEVGMKQAAFPGSI
jgi:dTMP kinase